MQPPCEHTQEGGSADSAQVLKLQQSKYGLGDRRTLDQLILFSGVDVKNRRFLGNKCGNLDYVPFTEHPWGAAYVPTYHPETEAFLDLRDPGSIYFDPARDAALWRDAPRNRLALTEKEDEPLAPVAEPLAILASRVDGEERVDKMQQRVIHNASPSPHALDYILSITAFYVCFIVICAIVALRMLAQSSRLHKTIHSLFVQHKSDENSSIKNV